MVSLMKVSIGTRQHEDDELYKAITNRNEKQVELLLSQNEFDLNRMIGDSEQIETIRKETAHQINRVDKLEDLDEHLRENLLDKIYSNPNYPVGETYLHVALKCLAVNIIKILVKNGASITAKNIRGETIFQRAFQTFDRSIIEFLVPFMDVNDKDLYGRMPLHYAVHYTAHDEDLKIIKMLIAQGANSNIRNSINSTPFHIAVKKDKEEIAKLMLSHGADPNLETLNGSTPLHIAIRNKSYPMVNLLLKYKADVNAECREERLLKPIHMAVHSGDFNIVTILASNGADVNASTKEDETPINIAVSFEHITIAQYLIKMGVNITVGKENQMLLYIAVKLRNGKLVKLLLENKAMLDNFYEPDGMTALHLAIENRDYDIIEILLAHGADVNVKVLHGTQDSAFMRACLTDDIRIVETLLKYNPNINSLNALNQTALYLAAASGMKNIVLTILKYHPDKKENQQVLSYAVRGCTKNHREIVSLLLGLGYSLDFLNFKDVSENSPLIQTVRDVTKNGYSDLLSYLLSRGVHPDINLYEPSRNKLVHYAVMKPNDVRLLLIKGADVDALNAEGQSPISLAVHNCAVETVELLINYGIDVSEDTDLFFHVIRKNSTIMFTKFIAHYKRHILYRNEYCASALHIAAWIGNEFFVQTILNMIDEQRYDPVVMIEPTHPELMHIEPLHCAAFGDHPRIVQMLMDRGHRIDTSDGTLNVLHLACLYDKIEVVHAILNYDVDITTLEDENRTVFELAILSKEDVPVPHHYKLFATENMLHIPAFAKQCSPNCSVFELLISHLVIIQQSNPFIKKDQFYCGERDRFLNCYNECVDQFRSAQQLRVHNHSIQDLLLANVNRLKGICLNPSLREAYREIIANNHLRVINRYECTIVKKMDHAMRRADIYLRARQILMRIFRSVPFEVIVHLLSYCRDYDLINLVRNNGNV